MASGPHILWCLLLFVFPYWLPGLTPKQVFCPWPPKGWKGLPLSFPSTNPLYPHSLSFCPTLELFQPGSPILGSLVHITSFWIIHNLLFYVNYLCCIIFGLALKVDYPSHHSSMDFPTSSIGHYCQVSTMFIILKQKVSFYIIIIIHPFP